MTDEIRLIVEFLSHGSLFEENRIQRARRILGPDYPEELFQQLINPPIADHKYLEWMAKQLKAKGRGVSIDQLKDYVSTFHEKPRHMRQQGGAEWERRGRDIHRWTGDALAPIAKRAKAASDLEAKPLSGFKRILDNNRFWIGKPLTHYSSVWFAHYFHPEIQARWCSAAYDNDAHFKDHKEHNITYIWDKQEHDKYAVIPGHSVWDASNNQHPLEFLDQIIGPELRNAVFPDTVDPEVKKKANAEAERVWNGGASASVTGLDIVNGYRQRFHREPQAAAYEFRNFVRSSPSGTRARIEAVIIARALENGQTEEQGIENFRAREETYKRNAMADFVVSRYGSYRSKLVADAVPQAA